MDRETGGRGTNLESTVEGHELGRTPVVPGSRPAHRGRQVRPRAGGAHTTVAAEDEQAQQFDTAVKAGLDRINKGGAINPDDLEDIKVQVGDTGTYLKARKKDEIEKAKSNLREVLLIDKRLEIPDSDDREHLERLNGTAEPVEGTLATSALAG